MSYFMPLFFQGVVPFIVSLYTGSMGRCAYGLLFTVGAGSDLLAVGLLWGLNSRANVLDHPDKMVFFGWMIVLKDSGVVVVDNAEKFVVRTVS